MSFDVTLSRAALRFPTTCVRCLGPASGTTRLVEYKPWEAVRVPTCRRCGWFVLAGLLLRRGLMLSVGTACAWWTQRLVAEWVVPRFPALRFLELVSWLPGAALGGFLVAAVFVFVFEPSVEVSFDGGQVTLECANREWAEALAALNPPALVAPDS
ncbi:MAG: hypothetical protein MUC96_35510 [Myxococcaceae bacterium]|nr:hypothetical protein [Myxococcaceae bacterium]